MACLYGRRRIGKSRLIEEVVKGRADVVSFVAERSEPAHVLQDDLRDAVQATSVLSLIGQGMERPSEIAGRLQIPATVLGRPLKRLMDLGFRSPRGTNESKRGCSWRRIRRQKPFP